MSVVVSASPRPEGAPPEGAAPPSPPPSLGLSGKVVQLLGWDRARWRAAVLAALAGIVVCGLGEAVTAQAALLPITGYAWLAWLLSLAAVAAANLAAWAAGSQWHTSRVTAGVLGVAWATGTPRPCARCHCGFACPAHGRNWAGTL